MVSDKCLWHGLKKHELKNLETKVNSHVISKPLVWGVQCLTSTTPLLCISLASTKIEASAAPTGGELLPLRGSSQAAGQLSSPEL